MTLDSSPTGTARQLPDRENDEVRDRFLGCLLGGAVGDALGAPVEFMSIKEIRVEFGRTGIRDFVPAYGRLGSITDDTQMTLFTAEGLIRGWIRGQTKGIASYPGVTAHAYLRWLMTQGDQPTCEVLPNSEGWLYGHQELHHSRAPGATCISALRQMQCLGDFARNNSKGCGGVMRVAPVGLFAWHWRCAEDAPSKTFDLASDLAAITHGHPTGRLASGVLGVLVLGLISGLGIEDALDVAISCLKDRPKHEETLQALEQARDLARSKLPVTEAIAELGGGWIAEEALAIALYCALKSETLEEGVAWAVNHSGDSDSTGSIAGNLLGALHGVDAIPDRWLNPLELRGVISEMGNDLFDFGKWKVDWEEGGEYAERIMRKYPPI